MKQASRFLSWYIRPAEKSICGSGFEPWQRINSPGAPLLIAVKVVKAAKSHSVVLE